MELNNEFRVSVPVEQAWAVLTDVERIAPCMPGAQLQEVEGDEYRGVVKVKVGPITAQYKGVARFVELDEGAHRAVLKAEGRDTRGQGNANATVTAELKPAGEGTAVAIVTDLTVTGKVAQFGRGVLADVSGKLLGQFVDRLEADVLGGAGAPGGAGAAMSEPGPAPAVSQPAPEPPGGAATAGAPGGVGVTSPPALEESGPHRGNGSGPAGAPGVRRIQSAPAEPVDLIQAAGGSVAKRVVPVVAGIAVLFLLWRLVRRGR